MLEVYEAVFTLSKILTHVVNDTHVIHFVQRCTSKFAIGVSSASDVLSTQHSAVRSSLGSDHI